MTLCVDSTDPFSMNVNSDEARARAPREAPCFNAHVATRIICHTCVDM